MFPFRFLKKPPRAEIGSADPIPDPAGKRFPALFALVLVLMASGIAAIVSFSYGRFKKEFLEKTKSQIRSIADLKTNQLEGWRRERFGDAEVFFSNPAFAELVGRFFTRPGDARIRGELRSWLSGYQAYGHYDRLFLLDPAGLERLSVPGSTEPVPEHLAGDIHEILSAGKVAFLDFHEDTPGGSPRLAFLVPIIAGRAETGGGRPIGLLVLHIKPETFLYPFIQEWPISMVSGETLLVRREGEDVLFLNSLKFDKDAALRLRIPLTRTEVPAVKAALGQEGIAEGEDYRGVRTLAALRAVPGTPWFLVAKLDAAEAYAPVRSRFWQTVVLLFSLVAASGLGLGMMWRHQRSRYYRGRLEAMQALRQRDSDLKALSTRQKALLDAIPDIIMEVDRDKRYKWANRAGLMFFGDDIFGREASDYFEGDQNTYAVVQPLFEGDETVTYVESWQRRKDGEKRLLGWWCRVLKDEAGNVEGALSSARDITESRRLETDLRTSREDLRAALEVSNRSRRTLLSMIEDLRMAEADRESRVNELTTIHGAALRLQSLFDSASLARELIAIIETTLHHEYGAVLLFDESGRELVPFALSDQARGPAIIAAGEIRPDSYRFAAGEGVSGWVAETGRTVRLGDVRGDSRFVQVRKGILSEMCVPLKVGNRIIGVLNVESPHPDAYSESDQRVLETIASQMALSIQQTRLREEIQNHAVELDKRVRERTVELHAANQELEAFAYSVSHDLRAPLRAMDGFSAALLSHDSGHLDEQGRHYLLRIQEAARRMGQLINDLLDLSQITRRETSLQPVDLSALAREIAAELQKGDPDRRADFIIDEGMIVTGDAHLLRIALVNLLSNAWKFSSLRAPARIEVGVQPPAFVPAGENRSEAAGPAEKGRVYFVRDNGAGFDMAYAGKLFIPFQRLHSLKEFPGTGIGLVTVQRIVTRHGGRIWAEAAVNRGAAFYFTLGGG